MSETLTDAVRKNPENDGAWEDWFRGIYPQVVYIVASRSGGRVGLAEEMTQAALERFLRYRAYEKVETDKQAIAYLARSAIRLMIDDLEKQNREAATSPEVLDERADELVSEGELDESRELEALIDQLPENDQSLLRMVLSGCKIKEISEILQIGYSTVGMRIQRAKSKLRKIASSE